MAETLVLPRRLDKFIRDASPLSLATIQQGLSSGRVHVPSLGGRGAALDPQTLVFPDDVVEWDKKPLSLRPFHQTLVLNKPASVTSTARDPRGKQDLSAWLKSMPPGVFPVGRLDRETTGALLFTDDGDLATAVLHPSHEAEKLYWLWLNETLTPDDPRIALWLTGMPLLGSVARAHKCEILNSTPDMTELLVTLREGKNRQIRRMCRATDFRLLHLHRRAVGPIHVENMDLGQVRALTADEVESLWSLVGGRAKVHQERHRALARHARIAHENGCPNHRLDLWLKENPPPAQTEHESKNDGPLAR